MKKTIIIFVVIIIAAAVAFVFVGKDKDKNKTSGQDNKLTQDNMKISSPNFKNNEYIPEKFTCDGEDINPQLDFENVPAEAKSLVLVMDDPDASNGDWVHWTAWNIDPSTKAIAENSVPPGAIEGETSFGKPGYGGPCPPSGTHHYQFKLYALNSPLTLDASAKKKELEKAMEGKIIGQAQLVGLYQG